MRYGKMAMLALVVFGALPATLFVMQPG